jgi:hypothetical protein
MALYGDTLSLLRLQYSQEERKYPFPKYKLEEIWEYEWQKFIKTISKAQRRFKLKHSLIS